MTQIFYSKHLKPVCPPSLFRREVCSAINLLPCAPFFRHSIPVYQMSLLLQISAGRTYCRYKLCPQPDRDELRSRSSSYPQQASSPVRSRQVLRRRLLLPQPFACKSHKNIFVLFVPLFAILTYPLLL